MRTGTELGRAGQVGQAKVVLDSDVLIDHLRGRRPLRIRDHISVSVVTRTELHAGRGDEESRIEELLEKVAELDVDTAVARRAGHIKRNTGLQIADALIAATALAHELPLMTRNPRHFERVPGLIVNTPDDPSEPPAESAPPADAA